MIEVDELLNKDEDVAEGHRLVVATRDPDPEDPDRSWEVNATEEDYELLGIFAQARTLRQVDWQEAEFVFGRTKRHMMSTLREGDIPLRLTLELAHALHQFVDDSKCVWERWVKEGREAEVTA